MNWFGEPYPSREVRAPFYESNHEVPVPVGEKCVACEETINATARGFLSEFRNGDEVDHVVYHRLCFLKTILPTDLAEQMTDA